MKKLIAPILLAFTFNSFAVTDPTSLKLKVYQISAAANDDCSSPQTIFTSAAGTEFDFISNPTLGSGNLPDGTYNCIMITMDDVIKFAPLASEGTCTAGTEYSIDLCRDLASSGGAGNELHSHTDLLEGTTTTYTECQGTDQAVGSGGVANKVTLYLRTSAPANNHPDANHVGSWVKGTTTALSQNGGTGPAADSSNGIQLSSAFVISGTKVGTFYVDASGKVEGGGGNCEMDAPIFGFRD